MTPKITLKRTIEFRDWYESQTAKEKVQIDERLSKIEMQEHFGDHKQVGDVFELRWKSGRRIYYAWVEFDNDEIVLVLLGGNKNGQSKDIRQAERILYRETSD